MSARLPQIDRIDQWAEALVAEAMRQRDADPSVYARTIRGDDARYLVVLTHRDTPAGLEGSLAGKPNYEIELDRGTKSLTRVSIAR